MDDTVIKVENISKRYHLGSAAPYKTLRESIVNLVRKTKGTGKTDDQGLPGAAKSGELWALHDVSFEVKQGDIVGIIGRNGAGKSTLLKILARITEPTAGRVTLQGRVGSLLEVGTGFHPELSGHENIYLYGAILGMNRYEVTRKFDEIIAFAELEKFVETPVKRYSSGMYMRLAFAVAAHLEPEILLVDEVLAVGDVQFQKKCIGKMGDVTKEGRTVLFVSHNMAAIRKLCSKCILLDHGSVMNRGPTEEVVSHYLNDGSGEMQAKIPLPPGQPDSPGRSTWLSFLTMNGELKTEFRIGETWRIRLEFEIFKPLKHVIAAVGIWTTESVPLITYWSMPSDLSPGEYCVEFQFDVPCKSSNLNFGVGLSTFERAFYYVEGTGTVAINEISVGEQPVRSKGAGILCSFQQNEIKPLKR